MFCYAIPKGGFILNIVVLAGGLSTERSVSLISGNKVAAALRERGHKTVLIDAFLGCEEELGDLSEVFENNCTFIDSVVLDESVPDLEKVKNSRKDKSNVYFGKNVIELCRFADIVFLALHGDVGENGKLQAAFDLLGVRYTGSPCFASALAMDKGTAKCIFNSCGIKNPAGAVFTADDLQNGRADGWNAFPCVVKPCCGGSSVGVSVAYNKDEFYCALNQALGFENEVLAEEYIKGREFSVGVIDGKALPIIEIIPKSGFYDYANKYQSGRTLEVCPAELDAEITARMQRNAERVYEVLKLEAYGRIDFLLDCDNNIYCLEANTLPGMTPMSLIPQEAAAVGIGYPQLCEKIIEISLKKYGVTV